MSTRRQLPAVIARTTIAAAAIAAAAGYSVGRQVAPSTADVAAPLTVAAQAAPGPVYAVPALHTQGNDDVCESWLAVQNVGQEATQAVLVVLGGAAPGAAGDPMHSFPVGVMCTGLIQPGSSWHLVGALLPSGEDPNPTPMPGDGSFTARQRVTPTRVGRRAALIFSVSPDRLADVVADPEGALVDDIAAHRLCELLQLHARADSAAWSDFLAAWWSGGTWHDVPLGAIAGEPLRVHVHRACPGSFSHGVDATSGYDAPRVAAAVASAYRAVVPVVSGSHNVRTGGRRTTMLYVQNVGRRQAAVTVRFQADGACTPVGSTTSFSLQPGDAGFVEPGAAVDDDWLGSAIVEADAPVAVAAADAQDDSLRLEVSIAAAVGAPEPAGPRYASVLVGPGAHAVAAHIVNAGAATVRPRLTVRDAGGRLVDPPIEGEPLCPGGSTTLSQTVTGPDPAGGAFLVQIDAVGDDAGATQLPATVEVALRTGLPGIGTAQAYAVAARTVRVVDDLAATPPQAVPIAMRALESVGLDVDLSVSLVGGAPGTLVYSVLAYDHNGLVGGACRIIESGQSAVVPIADVQGLPKNMFGSAIIAVREWFPAPSATGPPGALVASVIMRRGTFAGSDIPGDEVAAAAALPIDDPTIVAVPPLPCEAVPEPPPAPAAADPLARSVLYVPTLNLGGEDVCLAAVRITNEDSAPVQLVAVTFSNPGFADPACAGPMATACSPLIAPGKSWDLRAWEIGEVSSAVVIGLKGTSLDALGLLPDEARTAAEILCEDGGLVDDCAAWRRFAVALGSGGRAYGFRLADVAAPISGVVARVCPNELDPSKEDVSNYAAVPMTDVVRGRTRPGRYVYTVARAYAAMTDPANPSKSRTSVLYIQNAGPRTVSFGLTNRGDDRSVAACSVFWLAAGETFALSQTDCVGPEWTGWVTIAADGPLAVMTDVEVDPLTSRPSTAGGDRCDVNADGRITGADLAEVFDARGSAPGASPPGGSRWNPRADVDLSGFIDGADEAVVAACLGPGPTPTDILPFRPTDATPTLWSPVETPGVGETPHPDPTGTSGGPRASIHLPYAFNNRLP